MQSVRAEKAESSSPAGVGSTMSAGIVLLLLGIAIAAVMGRAWADRFVDWDDPVNVALNPDLNPPTASSLAKYWLRPQLGLYTPVVFSMWSAIALVSHPPAPDQLGSTLDPAAFHIANLFGHLAASFIAWQILRRLLRDTPIRDSAACAAALLFALHPLQVEPVAWVTGLKDVLGGVITLGALLLYVIAVEKSASPSATVGRLYSALATLVYAVALATKPSATCLPLMAVVVDHLIFGRKWRSILPLIVLWSAMALLPVVVTRAAQISPGGFSSPMMLRPFVALDAIGFYVEKLLIPIGLGVDPGRSPMRLVLEGTLRWSWIPGLLTCLTVWLMRRWLMVAVVPFLLFLAGLAPVLGFIPFTFQRFSTVADRYAYVAMLGPALLLARLLARRQRVQNWIAAGAIIASCAVISFVQGGYWHDDVSLMTHSLAVNPESQAVTEMLAAGVSKAGELEKGNAMYFRAIGQRWDDTAALTGLGSNLHRQGRLSDAQQYLERAVLISPEDPNAHYNLGNVLLDEHAMDQAIDQYRIALELRPRDVRVLLNIGAALAMTGKWSLSEIRFRDAIRAAPGSPEAHSGLARVLEQGGDLSGALAEYETALQLNPELRQAGNGRARILQSLPR